MGVLAGVAVGALTGGIGLGVVGAAVGGGLGGVVGGGAAVAILQRTSHPAKCARKDTNFSSGNGNYVYTLIEF